MSGVALTFDIRDGASPALLAKLAAISPEELQPVVGPALQDLTREHLGTRPRNKKGWPSTRFYENFLDNVEWLPHPSGVVIAIFPAVIHGRNVSLRQRLLGGPITPRTAKALAIPISPVSYGKVPSDFPGLFLIKTKKGAYLVQYGLGASATGVWKKVGRNAGGNSGRRRDATLNFLFVLKGGVNQNPDDSVLPSMDRYLDRAIEVINTRWRDN